MLTTAFNIGKMRNAVNYKQFVMLLSNTGMWLFTQGITTHLMFVNTDVENNKWVKSPSRDHLCENGWHRIEINLGSIIFFLGK